MDMVVYKSVCCKEGHELERLSLINPKDETFSVTLLCKKCGYKEENK